MSASAPASTSTPAEFVKELVSNPVANSISDYAVSDPAAQTPNKSLGGWVDFVKKVKDLNPIIGSKLESCSYSYDSNTKKLYIRADEKIKFMEAQLRSEDFLKRVRNYFNSVFQESIEVIYASVQNEFESEKTQTGNFKSKMELKKIEIKEIKKTELNTESKMKSNMEPKMEPKMELNTEFKMKSNMEPKKMELEKSVIEQESGEKNERLAKLKQEVENHSVIKTLTKERGGKIISIEELKD